MKTREHLALSLAVFVFCLLAYLPVNAQNSSGQVITVNNGGDSHDSILGDGICADDTGQCTLRAAIEEANSTTQRDAIIFGLPYPFVIDLSLGQLTVSKALDIIGPGARRLFVRRNLSPETPNFRIFYVPPGPNVLNIRGMTIINGNDLLGGGMLFESGSVVGLFDMEVRGNHAQLGGGIMSSGKLSILRCLIDSNISSTQVGGIVNSGAAADLTIVGSTITGNSAPTTGALYNEGTVLLVNNTIAGNSATQGVSGIFNAPQGTMKVLNTIIGPDTSASINTLSGAFQSAGNNIVTDSRGSTGFTNGVNSDQVSESNAINALLGPLADNGGQTNTMSLLTGSPAIKGGNVCATTGQCPLLPGIIFRGRYDQRHLLRRFFETSIDVGAFESNALVQNGSGSFAFLGSPSSHYAGTLACMINPTTLERRYTMARTTGNFDFRNLPTVEVYILEIRSKRAGFLTPLVIGFD